MTFEAAAGNSNSVPDAGGWPHCVASGHARLVSSTWQLRGLAVGMAAGLRPGFDSFGEATTLVLQELAAGNLPDALSALKHLESIVQTTRRAERLRSSARGRSEPGEAAVQAEVTAGLRAKLLAAALAAREAVDPEDVGAIKGIWHVCAALGSDDGCAWFSKQVLEQFKASHAEIER